MKSTWRFVFAILAAMTLVLPGCVADSEGGKENPAKGGKDNPVKLGPNASFGGKRLLPDDNPWNQEISKEPVDPNSENLIKSIGLAKPLHPDFGTTYQGNPNGIPYVIVSGDQKKV